MINVNLKYSKKIQSILPKPKSRQNTTLLKLIESTVKTKGLLCNPQQLADSYLNHRNHKNFNEIIGCRIGGRKAARFVIDQNPDFFKYDPSRGYFNCYAKSRCIEKKQGCYSAHDLDCALQCSDISKSSEIFYNIVDNSAIKLEPQQIQTLFDFVALRETLKFLQIDFDHPDSYLIRDSLNFKLYENEPIELDEDDEVMRMFNALNRKEASHYDTIISYLCITNKLKAVLEVYKEATEGQIKLNYMSHASIIVAKSILDHPEYNSPRRLNYVLDQAGIMDLKCNTKSINRLLHSLTYKCENRFVGIDLLKNFIAEMKHIGIQPDITTYSVLYYLLHRGETHRYITIEFIIRELESIPADNLKICIQYPSIICLMINRLLESRGFDLIERLHKLVLSNRSYTQQLPTVEYQIILEKYAIALIHSERPSGTIMKLKSFVPSSYILKPHITTILLDRVIETNEYECIEWIYQVLIEYRKSFCTMKKKLLELCLQAARDLKTSDRTEVLYIIQKITSNSIDETLSIYRDKMQTITYDFASNIDTLSRLVLISIHLDLGEELMKLRDKIFEFKQPLSLHLKPDSSEIAEFVSKNPVYTWLLELQYR
ncbi:MAG: Pentatricopeptide repeat domain-containing protein 3, mitochondrial [Marteilia pararefringens]